MSAFDRIATTTRVRRRRLAGLSLLVVGAVAVSFPADAGADAHPPSSLTSQTRVFGFATATKTTTKISTKTTKTSTKRKSTKKVAAKPTTTTTTSTIPNTTTSTIPGTTTIPSPSPSPSPTTAPAAVATASFGPCTNSSLDCANISVPLDHANPGGAAVMLFVSRRRADQSRRLGVLFVNPGGPGGPAYDTVRSASTFLTPEVLDRFDIVGVDPRGTQRSAPLICDSVRTIRTSRLSAAEQLAQACAATDSERLRYMDTETAARDLDVVRAAIGEEKIAFLGMSYGTYLGSVYQSIFPDRVASMVLDSAIDPSRFGVNMLVDPVIATERALDAFFLECSSGRLKPCAFNDGSDLNAKYLALREKSISGSRNGRELATQRFDETIADLVGYPRNGWPILARALEELQRTGRGDFQATAADNLASSNDERPASLDSFSTATNVAITCRDGILPRDAPADQLAREQIAVVGPRFSGLAANAQAANTCETWSAASANLVPLKPATSALLVIGNTYDLTTPYPWSEALSRTLNAPLLTRNGGGHVAVNKSACIREAVARLLIDRVAPVPGTVCSPDLSNPT